MISERSHKTLIAIVVVLAAMNIATLGTIAFGYFNQQKTKVQTPRTERPLLRDKAERLMVRELNLTPEQAEEFKSLRDEFRTETAPVMQQIRQLNKEIFDELSKETPSEGVLIEKADKVGLLYGEHRALTVKHMLKVRGICSPEQCRHLPMFFRNMNPDQEPMHQSRMRRNRR
ncbi:MAG: periplasmic heavy metal sensor [Bacteroidales bacterium]|nr:periplasmic heavy metal sensor [Bacteroidales bacterium]MBN2750239.1 periplasmic heavy metal sensor [Bacteroidales bacterium]